MASHTSSEETSRGLSANQALFPSSQAYILSTQADQTFIATEDTGQQLGCLLSPGIAQRELYICPNWNKLRSFTSNCFATESGAFSGSEFFMKWYCFPQNISIFHWKPEQANQETRWNTSVLKGHHSTPEVSSPSRSHSLLGTLPSVKLHFPTTLWPGSTTDARLPTYTREEYHSL